MRIRDKEKAREHSRKFRETHAEEVRAYMRAYRILNRDRLKEKRRELMARKRRQYGESLKAARLSVRQSMAAHPMPSACEACGNLPEPGKRLCWDHDHKTGFHRGWLCSPCNLAAGNLRDDPERARKLATYLSRADEVSAGLRRRQQLEP